MSWYASPSEPSKLSIVNCGAVRSGAPPAPPRRRPVPNESARTGRVATL